MTDAMTNHSDMESLAAFLDGRLEREEREAVTQHLQTCEECQGFVREAAAFEQEEEVAAQKRRKTMWMRTAASVAIVVLTGAVFMQRWEPEKDNTQKLYAALRDTGRSVEGRLAGQSTYAKKITRRGGTDKTMISEDIRDAAAAELAAEAEKDLSPAGRRKAALAATVKDPAKALAILNGIPEQARDAAIWNDIAALRYHFQDNRGALTAVKEALRDNPEMPEALFNRALILQALSLQANGDHKAAVQAWVQYVAVDKSSTWADEAPRKLQDLMALQ